MGSPAFASLSSSAQKTLYRVLKILFSCSFAVSHPQASKLFECIFDGDIRCRVAVLSCFRAFGYLQNETLINRAHTFICSLGTGPPRVRAIELKSICSFAHPHYLVVLQHVCTLMLTKSCISVLFSSGQFSLLQSPLSVTPRANHGAPWNICGFSHPIIIDNNLKLCSVGIETISYSQEQTLLHPCAI